MPIYEYVCQTCAYRFEVKQSIKDDPITTCSRCGKDVTKVISSPAIMFKGSGWYITDYSDKLKPPTTGEGDKPTTAKDQSAAAPTPSPTSGATSKETNSQPASSSTTSTTPATTSTNSSSSDSKT